MSDLAPAPAPFAALLEAQALAESILRRHLADLDAQPAPPSAPVLANAITAANSVHDALADLLEAQGLIRPFHPDDVPADPRRHDRPHAADDPLPGINSSPLRALVAASAATTTSNPARACTARSP